MHLPDVTRFELLLTVLEAMDEGVVVFDARGRTAYRNRCARRLVEAESDREPLVLAIEDVHRSLIPWLDGSRTDDAARASDDPRLHTTQIAVRTNTSEYRVRGAAVARDGAGASASGIVVTVSTRQTARHLTPADLTARYRLTPTEVRVAWLIEGGMRSSEIASALSISVNTARRHAEAVLRKLRVNSRPAVRARLRRE